MPTLDARLATAVRYQQARNYPAAEGIYRHVLNHAPNDTDAALFLGVLLTDTRRPDEAVDVLLRGIAVSHNPVELRRALVNALVGAGDLEAALGQAREVVRAVPTAAEPLLVLAQLFLRTGDHAAAEGHARRALELAPAAPVGWVVLARAMSATGRPGEAVAAYDRALAVAATFADAVVERAYLLQVHGRLEDAVAGYEQAVRLAPNNLAVLNNLGACLMALARPTDALRCFEAASQLSPTECKPRNNVGAALKDAGRIDDALPQLALAAQLDPADPMPLSNTGSCHAAVADHRRAIEAYRAAEAVAPSFDAAGSNALLSLLAVADATATDVRAAAVDWGRRHADAVTAAPPVIVVSEANRRLRIGYVSPDFREHSVRYFIEPVLAAHDRSAVEVVCYAVGNRRDEATARLAKSADAFHDVAGRDAAQTAELIRSHAVDVLVDLAGHTADNRLLTFARSPAPVQVTWLGYPATTGLRAIGYRLSDAVADPAGAESQYVERLVRLPDAFFVYADDPAKPYDATLPADRNGHVTFGAFNSFTKVTAESLATWGRIVAAVPGSRLLMKARPLDNPSTRAAVVAAFAAAGVAAERLDLRAWTSLADHVRLLGTVDLMLDTFPYNGHTTTCQSLWMGAAVLTRYGDSFRSRVGLTTMTALGLPEFAVGSAAEFERRAVQLAADLTTLRDLRPTWRERMAASPLCDAARFTRGLEAAYRQMWMLAVQSGRP